MALFKDRPIETNTLALIDRWSMEGALGELDGRFGSPVDIHALVAERSEEPPADVPRPTPGALLMKPAGETDWQPLLLGISDAA